MECWNRTRTWAALAAVLLLLCTADPGSAEAGSLRGEGPGLESKNGKSVRLSLKISGAKKRKRRVFFYKSVARQEKFRPSVDRSLPSGR
jgi:hypothetical protein